VKRERASSPPAVHESLFESYVLTTPVLGGSSGLPSDALLDLCLQVSVCRVALTCLGCMRETLFDAVLFFVLFFLFHLFAATQAS
jgi:hypothetical protein